MSSSIRSRNNTFATLELDRASELRDDAQWLRGRRESEAARFLLMRSDGRALARENRSQLRELSRVEVLDLQLQPGAGSFLGSDDAHPRFLLQTDDALADRIATTLHAEFIDLRSAGTLLPAFDAGLFAYASGLANWQRRTRFCSACGAPAHLEAAGHRAKCTNPQCGIAHFPRTDPAIIVIVSYRDSCLLGRQASWPERRYSTLAGFVEPGETLEDAVRREVFEEAGVRVTECDYFSSQPWPFPASIMLGFTARATSPAMHIGPELEDARWFQVDEIVAQVQRGQLLLSPPVSVSYRLIEHWLRETAGIEVSELVRQRG